MKRAQWLRGMVLASVLGCLVGNVRAEAGSLRSERSIRTVKRYVMERGGNWSLVNVEVMSGLQPLPEFLEMPKMETLPFGNVFEEIGARVWKLVDASRINDTASKQLFHVLPAGVTAPFDLSGWKSSSTGVYRMKFEDFVGDTVADFSYRIPFAYDGTYRSEGKYLANISPAIDLLAVKTLFQVTVEANVLPSLNVGTTSSPNARAPVVFTVKVKDQLLGGEVLRTHQVYVQGDGKWGEAD